VIRFLADACLAYYIVSGCLRREPSMDFKSAASAKLQGKSDLEVLTLAAQEGRILVTQDVRTMPRHFADFLQKQSHSPGVIRYWFSLDKNTESRSCDGGCCECLRFFPNGNPHGFGFPFFDID
jgi:hypothetical protein